MDACSYSQISIDSPEGKSRCNKSINLFDQSSVHRPHLLPKKLSRVPLGWKHWILLPLIALIAILIPLSWLLWTELSTSRNPTTHPCAPGSWGDTSSNGLQSFFAITSVTSHLSFNAVKTLDIAWSIVIGRGGQALLLWCSYRVYTASLQRLMETTAIPYGFYVSIAFGEPNWASIWQMTKFLFRGMSAARHKVLIIWLITALSWVMTWQVLTDAVSSYASDGNAYTEVIGNSLISLDTFVQSDMAFLPTQNGQHCDFVPLIVRNYSEALQQVHQSIENLTAPIVPARNFSLVQFLVSDFHAKLGIKQGQLLQSQTVSIQVANHSNDLISVSSKELPSSMATPMDQCFTSDWRTRAVEMYPMFLIGGAAYDFTFPFIPENDNIVCGTQGKTYQWGFSIWPMIILICLHGTWVIGTYITWIQVNRSSGHGLNRCHRSLGRYRAVLDLSEAVHEELGNSLNGYSNTEIEKELERRQPVRYVVRKMARESTTQEQAFHVGISSIWVDNKNLQMEKDVLYE